jgi:hypothetical protein
MPGAKRDAKRPCVARATSAAPSAATAPSFVTADVNTRTGAPKDAPGSRRSAQITPGVVR